MCLELDTQKLPSYTLAELLRLIGVRAQQLKDVRTRSRVLQLLACVIGSGLVETFELRTVSAEGPRPACEELQSQAAGNGDEAAAGGDDELEIYDRSELNMYNDGLLFSRRALPALLACLEWPFRSSSGDCDSTAQADAEAEAEGAAWANTARAVLLTEIARLGERVRRCAELSRAEARSSRVEPSNELKCVQLQVRCSLLLLAALLRSPVLCRRDGGSDGGDMKQCSSQLATIICQLPLPDSLAQQNSFYVHIANFRLLLDSN